MKNFNLVELGIIHKNFSCFIEDFESDIQELTGNQELWDLIGDQTDKAIIQYGINNAKSLVAYAQQLKDNQELYGTKRLKDVNKIIYYLILFLKVKKNVDLLYESRDSLTEFLEYITELSDDNKKNFDTKSIDILFPDK